MKKEKGADLVEYVVPIIVIVLLVGAGLFYMYSNGSLVSMASKSSNMSVDKNNQKGVINEFDSNSLMVNPNAGDLGGSINNPVDKCEKGICSIDYGDFILNNIPENFNDFVQTSGTAGSVDRLSSYLNKLSKDMSDAGHFDLADEIQTLAIMGHNIALIMYEFEKIYNTCSGNTLCIDSYNAQIFPMPAGYDDSVMPFPENMTYQDLLDSGAFGSAINGSNTSPLAEAFVTQLNTIMNNSSVKNEVKGVVQELSWNIGTIGQDFYSNYNSVLGNTVSYYDPVTGQVSTPSLVSGDPVEDFVNYSASNITHFNSAMICSVSFGTAEATTCH